MHFLETDSGQKIGFEIKLRNARWLKQYHGVDLLTATADSNALLGLFQDPLLCFELAHNCAVDFDGTLEEFEDAFDAARYTEVVEEVGKEILFFCQSLDPRKGVLLRKSIEKMKRLGLIQIAQLEKLMDNPEVEAAMEKEMEKEFQALSSTLLKTIGNSSTSGPESSD